MRVLLIEDDRSSTTSVEAMLKSGGYACDYAELGQDEIEISKLYDYDAIILNFRVPDIDGLQVLRKLRVANIQTPIMILSGPASRDKKIKGLADTFITKPFEPQDLFARLQSMGRYSENQSRSIVVTGRMTINLGTGTVQVDGQKIHLTGKEYGILELLTLRKGSILTKEMFLSHLYGGVEEPGSKIIDVFICKLRKKLTAVLGDDNYIDTIRGRGFVLRDPPEPFGESNQRTLDQAVAP